MSKTSLGAYLEDCSMSSSAWINKPADVTKRKLSQKTRSLASGSFSTIHPGLTKVFQRKSYGKSNHTSISVLLFIQLV